MVVSVVSLWQHHVGPVGSTAARSRERERESCQIVKCHFSTSKEKGTIINFFKNSNQHMLLIRPGQTHATN